MTLCRYFDVMSSWKNGFGSPLAPTIWIDAGSVAKPGAHLALMSACHDGLTDGELHCLPGLYQHIRQVCDYSLVLLG